MSNNYSFEILHWEKNFGKPIESWTYLPIEKLIKERKDSRVNDGSLKLCSLTIEDGVVEKTERYNREFLLKNQEDNKYKCVHPNDIVINPMNLRFGAIAKSEHPEPVLVSGYYNVVSASKLVDTDYLNAFLKSTAMNYMYERVALGTLNEKKRVHLSELKKIVVPIPTIKEQLKIGQILSTWDKATITTEKLIETSKKQKKALMQQLLTGRKRLVNPETGKMFEGEWEQFSFGDIANISSKKHDPKKATISVPCVELEHIKQETGGILGTADSTDLASIKNKFTAGDVLFGKLRPYLKKYAFPSFDGVCSTEIWVLKAKKTIQPEYLYHFVQTNIFISEANKSAGSKMPRADWGVVSELILKLPSLEEQEKITAVLNAVDEQLELLEAKLAHFTQEKKALMQQLLTGKRRVNAEKQWR
ncbi:restriction endonuclease subunit S [Vibrio atlanticus]|uniref:Restriction endonuclease subunit S n=1 Tax=Vibrio atlanticus TaxID=693153 RepID=A0ABV4KTE4_9VIBR